MGLKTEVTKTKLIDMIDLRIAAFVKAKSDTRRQAVIAQALALDSQYMTPESSLSNLKVMRAFAPDQPWKIAFDMAIANAEQQIRENNAWQN